MTLNTSVNFQDMPPSPTLISDIERHVEKLYRFAPDMTSCRVTVRRGEHRHQKGNHYQVLVHVNMPGGELEVGRHAPPDHSHEDAYTAVHNAFDTLHRRMHNFREIRRGEVKNHSGSS